MPKKKSANTKKAEGNKSKDADLENKASMKVRIDLPSPPNYLCKVAKQEWKERGKELLDAGVIATLDMAAFAFYCDSFAKWQDLNKKLNKQNVVQETTKSQIQRINLISTAAEKYKDSCLKFLREFGMTPKARAGLDIRIHPVIAKTPHEEYQEKIKGIKQGKIQRTK